MTTATAAAIATAIRSAATPGDAGSPGVPSEVLEIVITKR